MPERIFNFNAGPATLPYEVLEQTAKNVVNYNNLGIGIIELSHRSEEFKNIIEEAENLIRDLLDIPQNYKVLFLQGGAYTQFAMAPMNLLRAGEKASYLETGIWSQKAIKEAKLFNEIEISYSSNDTNFDRVPNPGEYNVAADSKYLYYTSNNTIVGTQFHNYPETDKLLVCDMSSDLLSRPVDISRFGLIFAGAQKNIGPAGVTIVIIREDLLNCFHENIPTMLKYKTHAEKGSLFNTPPCFSIYVAKLVLEWLKKIGGVGAIEKINQKKAKILYDKIDNSKFYKGHARIDSRSLMNVTFNLSTPELEEKFIREAAAVDLNNLKGHRSVGGLRASIYNAFPINGVEKLAEFMDRFKDKYDL